MSACVLCDGVCFWSTNKVSKLLYCLNQFQNQFRYRYWCRYQEYQYEDFMNRSYRYRLPKTIAQIPRNPRTDLNNSLSFPPTITCSSHNTFIETRHAATVTRLYKPCTHYASVVVLSLLTILPSSWHSHNWRILLLSLCRSSCERCSRESNFYCCQWVNSCDLWWFFFGRFSLICDFSWVWLSRMKGNLKMLKFRTSHGNRIHPSVWIWCNYFNLGKGSDYSWHISLLCAENNNTCLCIFEVWHRHTSPLLLIPFLILPKLMVKKCFTVERQ